MEISHAGAVANLDAALAAVRKTQEVEKDESQAVLERINTAEIKIAENHGQDVDVYA